MAVSPPRRLTDPIRFTATIIRGSGRGKDLGIPTFNLNLHEIPSDVTRGIYAGSVSIDGLNVPAAMHYGPRPVFQDSDSFEVHVLGNVNDDLHALDVTLVARLRDVQNFASAEAMLRQIEDDIAATRAIMAKP